VAGEDVEDVEVRKNSWSESAKCMLEPRPGLSAAGISGIGKAGEEPEEPAIADTSEGL
jgi:hypothetical protein